MCVCVGRVGASRVHIKQSSIVSRPTKIRRHVRCSNIIAGFTSILTDFSFEETCTQHARTGCAAQLAVECNAILHFHAPRMDETYTQVKKQKHLDYAATLRVSPTLHAQRNIIVQGLRTAGGSPSFVQG